MIKDKKWSDDDVRHYVEISEELDNLSVEQNDCGDGDHIDEIHGNMNSLANEMERFEKKFGLDCNDDLWNLFEADIIRLYPEE